MESENHTPFPPKKNSSSKLKIILGVQNVCFQASLWTKKCPAKMTGAQVHL